MKYLIIILLLLSNPCLAEVIDTSIGKTKSIQVTLTFTIDNNNENEIINQDSDNLDQPIIEDYERMIDLWCM